MIAKKSDLILTKFSVINSHITFIPDLNDAEEIIPANYFDQYLVDLDFNVEYNDEHDMFRIVVSVRINDHNSKDENIPGYSIHVVGIAFFKFDEKTELNNEQKLQLLSTSGLSICITNLRAFIANHTTSFPWGPYSFYAIDVQDLLASKQNQTITE
ncbi:MAG: hypothetical protein GX877_01265 [Bacteroidales bacterium]|nr:hypothetical protein [Bacteroidales bacterium]